VTISQITGSAHGVILTSATYADPITVTATGTVSGTAVGIYAATQWTIGNYGSIAGSTYGIELRASGLVINAASGRINGGHAGIDVFGSKGTVDNAGSISATDNGVVFANGPGTIDNSGRIIGLHGIGVVLNDGGLVFNEANGTISDGQGVVIRGATGTVMNSGSIHGPVDLTAGGGVTNKVFGILNGGVTLNAAGTVANTGRIAAVSNGVYIAAAGSVTNGVTGTINSFGTVQHGGAAIRIAGLGTVDNSGAIVASNVGGDGILLTGGGTVVNRAIGGSISAQYDGVSLGKTGSVDNFGHIKGGRSGVYAKSGGAVTNEVGGAIRGSTYGIFAKGANATVENAGLIAGGADAVRLSATTTNRLIVDAGAHFSGAVAAVATDSSATNTLELTDKGAGDLIGLGGAFVGFQTVAIDAGAIWTIATSDVGFQGVTIAGLNAHDMLDIGNIVSQAGDTATLNSATDVLTVKNGGGTALATIQLAGSFAGDTFKVTRGTFGGIGVTLVAPPKSQITGTYAGGIALTPPFYTNPVTVTATGNVGSAGVTDGIFSGFNWSLSNYGRIYGSTGMYLQAGGAVTNHGVIGSSSFAGVEIAHAPGSVVNYGSINGGHVGVALDAGVVTNAPGGSISGTDSGLYLYGAGVVINAAGGTISSRVDGVRLGGNGALYNYGLIAGSLGSNGTLSVKYGVYMSGTGANTIVNSGTIQGGIFAGGTEAIIKNKGTISGTVLFDAETNVIVLYPGVMSHGVDAFFPGTSNTVELALAVSPGTLNWGSYDNKYAKFQALKFDPGAVWTVKSDPSRFSGVTIAGFNTHDVLDLYNLPFATGDKATLNSATDVLTVTNAGGTARATLQLSGSFAGYSFNVAGDGASGTDITLKSTGAAVPASKPASAYRQLAQFAQAVAMDRSTLAALAGPALYRPHEALAGGALAAVRR
jgi:hypothetical protein